jgi:hypothetical protein
MIHSRIQLDPQATISLRPGQHGTVEIVILTPDSDTSEASAPSAVIELSAHQLDTIREAPIERL